MNYIIAFYTDILSRIFAFIFEISGEREARVFLMYLMSERMLGRQRSIKQMLREYLQVLDGVFQILVTSSLIFIVQH